MLGTRGTEDVVVVLSTGIQALKINPEIQKYQCSKYCYAF